MRWFTAGLEKCPDCGSVLRSAWPDFAVCIACPTDPADKTWRIGPTFIGGVPIYEGDRHIATFVGDPARAVGRARSAVCGEITRGLGVKLAQRRITVDQYLDAVTVANQQYIQGSIRQALGEGLVRPLETDTMFRFRLLGELHRMGDLDRHAVTTVTGDGLDEIGRHVGLERMAMAPLLSPQPGEMESAEASEERHDKPDQANHDRGPEHDVKDGEQHASDAGQPGAIGGGGGAGSAGPSGPHGHSENRGN